MLRYVLREKDTSGVKLQGGQQTIGVKSLGLCLLPCEPGTCIAILLTIRVASTYFLNVSRPDKTDVSLQKPYPWSTRMCNVLRLHLILNS